MENSNETVTATAQNEQDEIQNESNQTETGIKLSPEELLEKLQSTRSEAKKYRQEKALLKQQLEALNEEVGSLKKQTLESQGNYKGLYEKLKSEYEETQNKFKTQLGKYAMNVIESSVKEQLLEAKCQRPDAILRLFSDRVTSFELDDDFRPSSEEIKSLVQEAQKEYSEWFKSETPKFKDGAPLDSIPKKPAHELSKEQILAKLKAMDTKRS